MKNSKGISLIALIITIIVIIILAAIVIGGVFNTPNDAKFANFCQQYDELQTQIQLKYYSLYQKAAIDVNSTSVPTTAALYAQVAHGATAPVTGATAGGWYIISFSTAESPDANKLSAPSITGGTWWLRASDGKLAYSGFHKTTSEVYYTPSVYGDNNASLSAEAATALTLSNANGTI